MNELHFTLLRSAINEISLFVDGMVATIGLENTHKLTFRYLEWTLIKYIIIMLMIIVYLTTEIGHILHIKHTFVTWFVF